MLLVRNIGRRQRYSLRVLFSRERFANRLRVYGIDRTSNRSTPAVFVSTGVAHGVAIRTVLDADEFTFADVANPDVVIWDLHESDERDRGQIFATLKAHLVDTYSSIPSRAAFVVDEAVTVSEDESVS